jgi:hypothetical protein
MSQESMAAIRPLWAEWTTVGLVVLGIALALWS